jgi:allantoate deiminase
MTQHQLQNAANVAELAEEVIARCQKLATFSEDPAGTSRTFLSAPMHDVHREISTWLQPSGIPVRVDAAGNLRAIYPAQAEPAPRLLIGSHLDTVPNAGAYDGILGVVLAVALLKALNGRRLPYFIEVVGFSEEEGVRFGVPFIGSRALVGRLDGKLLETQDARGISVRRAIADFGLDPAKISQASLLDNAFGYLEFHIEQGPVLDNLGLPLAVVDAIAGQSRLEFIFRGRANHAGTTPMALRHDALAGAAAWISIIEQEAKNISGLVATVGSVQVKPGATNVIAEQARLSLDVRHCDDRIRLKAVQNFTDKAQQIAGRRGLNLSWKSFLNQPAVAMDSFLKDQINQAIRKTGCEPHRMVSGAGHDAMILAERMPAAMVFLRTPEGISHDPKESVATRDVEKALECGLYLLDQLASSSALLKRTPRAQEPA